jgi:hypothetical protein
MLHKLSVPGHASTRPDGLCFAVRRIQDLRSARLAPDDDHAAPQEPEGRVTRPTISTITATCFALAACSSARAELTAFWRHNPITPEAIADDLALAGMQSWSAMITHDNGYWVSAGARLTLPGGSVFYRNALGSGVRPRAADIAAHPALAFHTYVTSPHHTLSGLRSPSILGPFPENEPPESLGGAGDPVPGRFSVSWGHPEAVVYPTPVGTYEIFRVTFPLGTFPIVRSESTTSTTNPDQAASIPAIPEPAHVTWLAAGALTMGRRRGRLNGSAGDDR